MGAATVENSVDAPQKLKRKTTLWPSDSTSGHLREETENTDSEGNAQRGSLQQYLHRPAREHRTGPSAGARVKTV